VRLLVVGFYRWQVIWLSQEIVETFFVYRMNLCTLKPGSIIPTSIVLFFGYCKIAHINNVWLYGMNFIFKCCTQHHSFRILGHGPQYFQNKGFWEAAAKWTLGFFKYTVAVSSFCFYQIQQTAFVLIFLDCVMIVFSPHPVPCSVPGVLLGGGEKGTLDICDWHWLESEADIILLLPKVLWFSLLVRSNSMTHCLVLQLGVAAVWLKTRRFQCMKCCGHTRISYVCFGN